MAQIHELSENLTNQIAAGEVIERPASVIKELVENAIDAGSSRIRVSFVNAGLSEIVVQDNGVGIAPDQIGLAFTRHATSKITNERDLFRVATLGFRGEALASIAAVSHVEIVTSSDGKIGTRAEFSAGTKKEQENTASAQGTKITVKDLFFNTPARLKYLRSPRTEIMKIVDIINRIALGYPEIAITLTNEKKLLLQTAGNGKLTQTLASVYGRHLAEQMLSFSTKNADFTVSGLISKPQVTRSTRNFISILLNGRYIKNFKLTAAVLNGYGSRLASGHYPIAVIAIKVDPFLVDVNVHPTKQEVRLSKETDLSRLITEAISSSFTFNSGQVEAAEVRQTPELLVDQLKFNLNQDVVNTKRQAELTVSEGQSEPHKTADYVDLRVPRADKQYLITKTWPVNVQKQTKLTPFARRHSASTVISTGDETLTNNLPELEYLGRFANYLLAQNQGNLFLVDQVAARRRLSFDQIEQELASQKIAQQVLLEPLVLEFGSLDFVQIKDHLPEIAKLGLMMEEFGQNAFLLRSYPTWIKGAVEPAVREILDSYLNANSGDKKLLIEKMAASQARKAISGKTNLTRADSSELLQRLRRSANPYNDAEGNVVIVRISKQELRKMFKKER